MASTTSRVVVPMVVVVGTITVSRVWLFVWFKPVSVRALALSAHDAVGPMRSCSGRCQGATCDSGKGVGV